MTSILELLQGKVFQFFFLFEENVVRYVSGERVTFDEKSTMFIRKINVVSL